MTVVLKGCLGCGNDFLTLWDGCCEQCQKPKYWGEEENTAVGQEK